TAWAAKAAATPRAIKAASVCGTAAGSRFTPARAAMTTAAPPTTKPRVPPHHQAHLCASLAASSRPRHQSAVCGAVERESPAARTTTARDGARPQASGQKGVAAVALTPTTVRAHRTTVMSSIFFLLRAAAAPAAVISVFMTSSPVVLTSELYQRGRVYVKRLLHRDKQIFR